MLCVSGNDTFLCAYTFKYAKTRGSRSVSQSDQFYCQSKVKYGNVKSDISERRGWGMGKS